MCGHCTLKSWGRFCRLRLRTSIITEVGQSALIEFVWMGDMWRKSTNMCLIWYEHDRIFEVWKASSINESRFFWNLHYLSDRLGHARNNLRDWCSVLSSQKATDLLGEGNVSKKQQSQLGGWVLGCQRIVRFLAQFVWKQACCHPLATLLPFPFRIDQLDSTACTTSSLVYLLFHVTTRQPSKSLRFGSELLKRDAMSCILD